MSQAPAPRWARSAWPILGFAILAVLVRVPLMGSPMLPDEGGFLTLASQWHPGTSLYGNYWVDRPPLLIAIYQVAVAMGGTLRDLRLLGLAVSFVATLAAGALGAVISGRRAELLAAATAAVFVSAPTLETWEINGEILALPWILLSLAALFAGVRAHGRWKILGFGALAGLLGTVAPLIKQSFPDALLAVLVAAVALSVHGQWHKAVTLFGGATLGGLLTLTSVLAYADSLGTHLPALWDAVFTFRGQAAGVIAASASSATTTRFWQLVLAGLGSGILVPLVLWLMTVRRSETRDPIVWPVIAALAVWEVFAIGAGGSYWVHYLIGLVPAAVLASIAVAAQSPWPRLVTWLTLASALVAAIPVTLAVHHFEGGVDREQLAYLRAHVRPGDTAVYAFGKADELRQLGLSSPYQYLWSLPVRVRDPHLNELKSLLDSPHPPTWVMLTGDAFSGWGLDPEGIRPVLHHHYDQVATFATMKIFRLRAG